MPTRRKPLTRSTTTNKQQTHTRTPTDGNSGQMRTRMTTTKRNNKKTKTKTSRNREKNSKHLSFKQKSSTPPYKQKASVSQTKIHNFRLLLTLQFNQYRISSFLSSLAWYCCNPFSSLSHSHGMSSGGAYRRVPSSPSPLESNRSRERERILARSEAAQKVSDKIHALFWVGLMAFVVVKSNLLKVCFGDADEGKEIHRLSFNAGVVCIVSMLFGGGEGDDAKLTPLSSHFSLQTTMLVLLSYLGLYLPIMRISTPWDIYCPRVIPTIVIMTMLAGGCFMK